MQPNAAALQPAYNPARGSLQPIDRVRWSATKRKSMSTLSPTPSPSTLHFASSVAAPALAAPVAPAALFDASDATLRNDEAHYSDSHQPSGASDPHRPQRHSSQPHPGGAGGQAVSGSGCRSRRGRLRLDLRSRRRHRRHSGSCSSSASPPSQYADVSTSTVHRPDDPRTIISRDEGGRQAALSRPRVSLPGISGAPHLTDARVTCRRERRPRGPATRRGLSISSLARPSSTRA